VIGERYVARKDGGVGGVAEAIAARAIAEAEEGIGDSDEYGLRDGELVQTE